MSTKKTPARTWSFLLTLGVPLTVVGVAAMAISYMTLIDVARINGLPLPELFPVLVDVGTVASMIAAAQFRLRGLDGRWLAYTTFIALSVVSIVANASHAWGAADMTATTPVAAAILAATPPAALLSITHLVMMLIPDEKERKKLAALAEVAQPISNQKVVAAPEFIQKARKSVLNGVSVETSANSYLAEIRNKSEEVQEPEPRSLALVKNDEEIKQEAIQKVLEHFEETGKKPTGKQVGEWLGQSVKSGYRLLEKLEETGELNLATNTA